MSSVARSLSRLGGYLFFRLHQWIHFLALPFLGFDPTRGWREQLPPIGRGVAAAFLLLSFGYLINGYTEPRAAASPSKSIEMSLPFERTMVKVLLWLLPAAALGISLTGPPLVWMSAAVCVLSGIVYSAGPALKSYPLVGSAMNLTNFMPLMFLGMDTTADLLRCWTLVGVFGCLLLENQLLHEASDQLEDAQAGRRTTFLWLGRRPTALLCGLLGTGVAVFVASSSLSLAFGYAIACLVVFGIAIPWGLLRSGGEPAAASRLRLLHRWLSLATGVALYLGINLGLG